jgi:hypothetical protein
VFIAPDGRIASSHRRNRPGLIVDTVDTGKDYYDAAGRFRDLAIAGALNSGNVVRDARSRDRQSL